MAQFRGPTAMSGLVGAPSGNVGYGEGRLTNALRASASSVFLFDEIEMAEPPVLDLLMRFLDSGFVRDPGGPVCDGRKAIVVLATAAGHRESSATHEQDDSTLIAQEITSAALTALPRELTARVDAIVGFVPLSRAACREIVDTAIDRDVLRLFSARGIRVIVAEAVRVRIADEFHSRSLHDGARAAPRVVHKLLTLPVIDFELARQASGWSSVPARSLHTDVDREGKVCIRATEEKDACV